MSEQRIKVAILGGGLGGVTAAFYLTSSPFLRRRYHVTLHQMGWRLGGKAASGRVADAGQRIEEHGLHMLMGFYENAFRMLRAAYDEWAPPPDCPLQTWTDAFTPQHVITLMEQTRHGDRDVWEPWTVRLPERPGTPGDGTEPWGQDVLERGLDVLQDLAEELHPGDGAGVRGLKLLWRARGFQDRALDRMLERADDLAERLSASRLQAVHARGDRLRRAARLLQLGLVVLRGYLADVVPHGDDAFSVIDHLEFRDWLRRHGADDDLVWWGPVRALYTLGFAFRGGHAGDPDSASIAAGVALKILLRIGLFYKGAPLWRMHGGMGDVVFTPLYQVLRARGVDVAFFHRVDQLHLDGDLIRAVDVGVQARVPSGDYQPLVSVKGMPCWPSAPLWDQLEGASGDLEDPTGPILETRRLTLGQDFDRVVLAIPPAAAAGPCAQLAAALPAWRAMFEGVPSTCTLSVQVWARPTLPELGWTRGSTVMTAYHPPVDSWADMSHLIAHEAHDPAPGSLHYFCAALPDGVAVDQIADDMRSWLEVEGAVLFPDADWDRDALGGWDAQLVRVNTKPSDRYVQSFPGTIALRLAPDDTGVRNLVVAGDWVRTGLNAGSADAAVQGGMLAARALCGVPVEVWDG